MSFLQRTASNGFRLQDCHDLEQILFLAENGRLGEVSLTCENAFRDNPAAVLDDSAVRYYQNGGAIDRARVVCSGQDETGGLYRVYGASRFLGLGKFLDTGLFQSVWNGSGE